MNTQSELFERPTFGAAFSECRRYRYRLWRIWDPLKPPLCFIGLLVVNAFALVSSDPIALRGPSYPIGADGDDRTNIEILKAAREAKIVICGWGAKAGVRGKEVLAMLRATDIVVHALKLNKDGSPCHPLYLSYNLKPVAIV